MLKVDKTVRRETLYIAAAAILLSVVMEAVFLIIGQWNYTVILGNLLGLLTAVANFFLMGLSVQKAVNSGEEQAPGIMKFSQTMRTLMLFAVVALSAILKCFNLWAAIIPLFFPRIAIAFRPLFNKKLDMSDES